MKNISIGGQAHYNGITIYDDYKITSLKINKDDSLLIQVSEANNKYNQYFDKLYFLRGITRFLDSMILQINTTKIFEKKNYKSKKIFNFFYILNEYFILIITLLFFIEVPIITARLFLLLLDNSIFLISIEGIIRTTSYIILLSAIKYFNSTHQLLKYHAAEHMLINSFEKNKELTIPSIRKTSKENIRCGSTYFFILAIIYFVIFLILELTIHGRFNESLIARLAMFPVAIAISNELLIIIKKSKRISQSKFTKILLKVQKNTTAHPDDHHLQVALATISVHQSKMSFGNYNLKNFQDLYQLIKLKNRSS